jgi:hypothetical protein
MKNIFSEKIKILKKVFFVLLFQLCFSKFSIAAVSFPNPIRATDIRQLVKDILDVVVDFGAVIVVFFLVYAGFLFVKAQGNSSEIEKAKQVFFWTIVGGMIVLGAFVLSEVIQNTVNQITG